MASALGEALGAAGMRRVALRAAAMQTAKPSGGSAGGLYGSASGSNDPWSAADNVARLYAMASRGEAYSAIRPACVKMSNLVVRVGERDETGGLANREMRMREKAYAGDELAASRDLRHKAWLKTAPAFIKSLEESVDVLDDHPFLRRLARPNDYQTASSLLWCTAFSLCACGESIWLLDYDEQAKDLAAIYYLPRTWVTPVESGGNPFAAYRLTVPGQFADPDAPPIPGKYVVHVMTPNAANPVVPHSSTAAQGLAIATDAEIQTAQLSVTKNITKPGMLVVVGEVESAVGGKSQRPELTADQRRDITAQVRLHYQTASRVGDPLVLDRLIQDVRPYMPQPSDLDYQGGSSVISARIYQGYGTNPIVAGQVQSGNRAQALVAHESMDWLQVNPLATLIGEAMTAKIGPLYGAENAGKSLVIWIDPARAKDPELMQKRFDSVAKFGVLTKGQMREYLATGEYEYVPQDDDDEPAKAPGGASGHPGENPGAPNADPNADPNAGPPADQNVQPDPVNPPAKSAERKKRRQQAKALGLGGGAVGSRVYVVPDDGVKAARRVLRWLRDGALESLDGKSLAMARMLARGVVTSRGALKRIAASMADMSADVLAARERVNAESLNAWESPEIVKWLARGGAVAGAWACASLGDVHGADVILGAWVKGRSGGNCGTGDGGFKPGNTCASGGGGSHGQSAGPASAAPAVPIGAVKPAAKPLAKTSVVDSSKWPAHNVAAQWAANKISKMEKLAAEGKFGDLIAIDAIPKSKSPNPYQKAVHEAHQKLVGGQVKQLVTVPDGLKTATPAAKAEVIKTQPEVAKLPGGVIDATGWKKQPGTQAGSNEGGIMTAPNGDQYYVKTPSNPAHAKSEVVAAKLYALAGSGIPVVDAAIAKNNAGQNVIAVASKWEADAKGFNVNNLSHIEAAQKEFAVHAWLGNWDSVGLGFDNVLIKKTESGSKAMCIDAGGSLEFRDQGGAKEFGKVPKEWDSLRDPNVNPKSAAVFGEMTPHQLQESAAKLAHIKREDVEAIVNKHLAGDATKQKEMVDTLMARRDAILELGGCVTSKEAVKVQSGESPKTPVSVEVPQAVAAPKVAITPPAGGSSVPAKIPHPPVTASATNASVNAKLHKLYEAAQSGDVNAVNAIATNATSSQTYAKKAHAYKMQLLAAMGGTATEVKTSPVAGGAKPATPEVKKTRPKSTVAAPKEVEKPKKPFVVNADKLPPDPEFKSKQFAAANKETAQALKKMAVAGDIETLSKYDASYSHVLHHYKMSLLAEVRSQKERHDVKSLPSVKDFESTLKELASKVKVKSDGADKIGYWSAVGQTSVTPTVAPKWSTNQTPDFWKRGDDAFDKMSKQEQSSLKYYTGGSYETLNHKLRTGVPKYGDKEMGEMADVAANAVTKGASELPVGTTLSRKHDMDAASIKKLEQSVGKVVQDKGILSTSTDKDFWSGDVHWQMVAGPGVKGLPSKNFSQSGKHEYEVLLPPNTRMLITSVKKDPIGRTVVSSILLPFNEGQCCPP